MKIDHYKDMDVEALKGERVALLREQFNLRIKKATGQLKTTHLVRNVRRNIAKVNTILREKAGNNHE